MLSLAVALAAVNFAARRVKGPWTEVHVYHRWSLRDRDRHQRRPPRPVDGTEPRAAISSRVATAQR
jgi:hypothetical protein